MFFVSSSNTFAYLAGVRYKYLHAFPVYTKKSFHTDSLTTGEPMLLVQPMVRGNLEEPH